MITKISPYKLNSYNASFGFSNQNSAQKAENKSPENNIENSAEIKLAKADPETIKASILYINDLHGQNIRMQRSAS